MKTCNTQIHNPASVIVNDTHSQLNATSVSQVQSPRSSEELLSLVKEAARRGKPVSVAGGRHSMGGQQFLSNKDLIDMRSVNKVINFDQERGLLEVQAGIIWPEIIEYLTKTQVGRRMQWTIAQKQTGCDNLTIGGAIASNIHGRGLTLPPFVGDVEKLTLVNSQGNLVDCSRNLNQELFSTVIGGYGLMGIVSSATLRLVPKTILQRQVRMIDAQEVVAALEHEAVNGTKYGDFQFKIDDKANDFLTTGILSTYRPLEEQSCGRAKNTLLSVDDWRELLLLAHSDKAAAFEKYSKHYLASSGQLYESDTFQLATYMDGYHKEIDRRLPHCRGSETITELYVPRPLLAQFLHTAADFLREQKANVIYGTVRLIAQDSESFLAWAKQNWACIVFNLHVEHTPEATTRSAATFRGLIDIAIQCGGSYYLTYHRYATREQLLTCYPRMPEFFRLKEKYDPECRFSSDWFTHYKRLLEA